MTIKVTDYLKQEENSLICKHDCTITIDLNNFESADFTIKRDENLIWFKSFIGDIKFSNETQFSIILDYVVNVFVVNENIHDLSEKSETIILTYPQNTTILECTTEAVELKKQIHFVDRLLGGKEIYKDTEHIFRRLYGIYEDHSDMDIVHLEVLLSNCFRDKNNLSIPARLGKKWDPVMVNIKNIVFNSGFVNGLAFENITKAIEMGMIAKEDMPPSILEKVMTETLVEDKKRK